MAASGDPEDSKIVKLLLAAGADVTYETKGKPKAYLMAKSRGNFDSVKLILRKMTEKPNQRKLVSPPGVHSGF